MFWGFWHKFGKHLLTLYGERGFRHKRLKLILGVTNRMEGKLSARQQRFIDEYMANPNATQAAIRAGYSDKSAKEIGAQTLAKPYVRAEIEKRTQALHDSAIADQEEVLRTLTRIMRRETKESVVITIKSHKSGYDRNGKKKVADEETAQVVEIPSKLSDVNKAAELLGKYYGMWTDNTHLEGNVGVTIIDDIPDAELE